MPTGRQEAFCRIVAFFLGKKERPWELLFCHRKKQQDKKACNG